MTSAMVPPPMASGAEPAKPERRRQAKNWPMFWLRAQPTAKAVKTMLQAW